MTIICLKYMIYYKDYIQSLLLNLSLKLNKLIDFILADPVTACKGSFFSHFYIANRHRKKVQDFLEGTALCPSSSKHVIFILIFVLHFLSHFLLQHIFTHKQPWYLDMLRTSKGIKVFTEEQKKTFATAPDLNKCINQIILPISPYTCAPISKLPSYKYSEKTLEEPRIEIVVLYL